MLHFIYMGSQGPHSALVTVPLLWQCHIGFNNLELSQTLTGRTFIMLTFPTASFSHQKASLALSLSEVTAHFWLSEEAQI